MVLLKIKDSDEMIMHCSDGQLRSGKGIQSNYIDANSELEKKTKKTYKGGIRNYNCNSF